MNLLDGRIQERKNMMILETEYTCSNRKEQYKDDQQQITGTRLYIYIYINLHIRIIENLTTII